jgi:hypothetical protein
MFPPRTQAAFSALLDVADALLAPQPEREAPAVAEHPHRRPLASRAQRRVAPPRPMQPCLSPVAHRATPRRAAAPTAPIAAQR